MTFTFATKERILLLNVLPAQGDILALRALRKLREDLSFSETEIPELGITQSGNAVAWKPEANTVTKEIEISPFCQGLIVKALAGMNSAGTLTADHIGLYEQFIPEG